jgi:RHS repeat-associated protein
VTVSNQASAPVPAISVTGTPDPNSTSGALLGLATVAISIDPSITPGLNQANGPVVYYSVNGSTPARYTAPFNLPAGTGGATYAITAQTFQSGLLPSTPVNQTVKVDPATGTFGPPTASIDTPLDGTEISGATGTDPGVPITGVAIGPSFGYWELDYRLAQTTTAAGTSTSNWVKFAMGTSPVGSLDTNGKDVPALLGYLDTSLMLDGQYELMLTVYDTDGQAISSRSYVVVKGHQKIGYFTLSYTDMTIPIAGIPISITRTYDSRKKDGGDFGVGWTLSTTNVTVQKPEISTFDWEQHTDEQGFSLEYYVTPARAHNVTITLPGDMVFSFAETLNPNYSLYNPMADQATAQVVYQQLSGPKATLTPADPISGAAIDNNVYIASASDVTVDGKQDPNLGNYTEPGTQPVQLLDASDLVTPYQPEGFVLTMGNGVKYLIDTQGNLKSITDRNGNTVTFDASGIHDSTGKTIQITRAGAYITGITDPNGKTFQYHQNAAGDLDIATDRSQNATTYSYDNDHNLTGIKNALGIMPMENFYYPDGRLNYTLTAPDSNGVRHTIYNYFNSAMEPGGAPPPAGAPISVVPSGAELDTDALGNYLLVQTDSYGNVTAKTQYLTDATHTNTPVTWSYTYNTADPNNPDKPLKQIDPMGNETDFAYDSIGDTTRTTAYLVNPDGSKTALVTSSTYNKWGQLLSTQTPSQQGTSKYSVVNIYDDSTGNLQSTKDALGNTTSYDYWQDNNGRTTDAVQSITDALQHTTSFTYDSVSPPGNITVVTDPDNHVTRFGYDANGMKTSMTTTRTNTLTGQVETLTTTYVPDDSGRIVKIVAPDLSTTETHYNDLGQVDYTIDQLGHYTYKKYDPATGKLIETDYPDRTSSKAQFDADGRQTLSINESGLGVQYSYDTLGRQISATPLDVNGNQYSDGNGGAVQSTTTYDLDGNVLSTRDANCNATGATYNTTSFSYDSLGRKKAEQDALGNITTYQYTPDGLMQSRTDARKYTTTYQYYDSGQLRETDYPDSTSSTITYDANGRRTSITDQAHHTTQYHYNELGRMDWVEDPIGHITRYAYDELGNKTSQEDANGHFTYFAYDSMSRLIRRTLPDGQYETRSYDSFGRLQSETDENGATTVMVYDPNTARLTSKQDGFGNTLVSFGYYLDGTLKSTTRGSVTVTQDYDGRGRLWHVYGANGTLTYGYDFNGNRTSLTKPSGTVQYAFDADSHLSQVTHADGMITKIGYDPDCNRAALIRLKSDGTTTIASTTYAYDSLNRLTDIDHTTGSGATIRYHYGLNPDGTRASVTEAGVPNPGTTNYTYDANGRLIEEDGPNGDLKYIYEADSLGRRDLVGNRLQKIVTIGGVTTVTTYYYDTNDRLTQEVGPAGPTNYQYYPNGSLWTSTDPSGNVTTYAYDFDNDLTSISNNGSITASYVYDGAGNRVSQTTSASTVYYLVDGAMPYASAVEEFDANGNPIADFDYADDLDRMVRYQGNGGSAGGTAYYYLADGLGSTRSLVNASGSVTDTYAFDAYGDLLAHNGTTDNEFLFAGQIQDASGLYYLRARYYNPASGRFISQDPFSGYEKDPITLHRYLYAGDDPVDMVDPGGREFSLPGLMASAGVIAITASQELPAIEEEAQAAVGDLEAISVSNTLNEAEELLQEVEGGGSEAVEEVEGLVKDADEYLAQVRQELAEGNPFKQGGSYLGRFWNQLGETTQTYAKTILEKLGVNVEETESGPDFILRMGNKIAQFEVKYSLNLSKISSLNRLITQIRVGLSSGNPMVVWSLSPPTLQQLQRIQNALGPNEFNQVQFINGAQGIVNWVRLFFK